MSEKVLIVGAGLAGLSLAVHLARGGVNTIVYEQEVPGYGPSGRSAGLLVTLMPETLLKTVLETRDFYESLEEPGKPGLLREVRSLWIAPHRGGCVETLLRLHARMGLESRILDGLREASSLVGFQLKRIDSEEYVLITEYIVDVGSLVNRMVQHVGSSGGSIIYDKVLEVGDGWLRTSKGVDKGIVVVAAGAWSGFLLPDMVSSRLVVYRCQLASIEEARPLIPIEDDVLGYYIVPVSEVRSNIGNGVNSLISDPLDGYSTDLEDIYNIIEKYAYRTEEAWNARLIQAWSAPCNTGLDGLPLAGKISDKLYVLTGFNGAGVSLAPGLSKLVAGEIMGTLEIPRIYNPIRTINLEVGKGKPREPYDIC